MKNKKILILVITLISIIFFGCSASDKNKFSGKYLISSYTEIPGVTQEEKNAIARIRENNDALIYGMPLSTEAFKDKNGDINGFTALFCEWLSGIFGITFRPALYEWNELLAGLETGEISFTGELTARAERLEIYRMTSAIAMRPLKYFRLAGANPLDEIIKDRRIRCGFIKGTATIFTVSSELDPGAFEAVILDDVSLVYDALKSGKIDAFYYTGTSEINFIEHSDMAAFYFYPLIYSPVSLSTHNPALDPIISAVEKILQTEGSLHYLTALYNKSHTEYMKHKVQMQLTEEEFNFIRNNPTVPVGVDPGNYPGSFYDAREKKWRGTSLDILDEISYLTGLTFNRVNDEHTQWPQIFEMLKRGDVALVTELNQSHERDGQFLWPGSAHITDFYALISHIDFPDIKLNEVLYARVGLAKNTAYAAVFNKWFPGHTKTVEYESVEEAFAALMRGEIDMVMANQRRLLYLTHYMELPDYKTNIVFDYAMDIQFGINKNAEILCSIIDKALVNIDTKSISDHWLRRTYDYRSKVVEAQRPLFMGLSLLFLLVLTLIAVFFVRSRMTGRNLEKIVKKRTDELALQTATLTTLFDSIPDLIFTKDLSLKYKSCNKAFLKNFDKRMEDMLEKTDSDVLDIPADIAGFHMEHDAKAIYENCITTVEENIPCADGTSHLYETTKVPLMLNGAVVGIIGISHNISKLKKIEQETAFSYEYSKKLNHALAKITKSPTISAGILKDASDIVAQEGCTALSAHRIGIWSYFGNDNILKCISSYDMFTNERDSLETFNLTNHQEYLKLLKSERLIIMNNIDECRLITDSFSGYDFLCAALDAPIRVDGQMVGVVCVEQWICDDYPQKREWTIEEQNFASSLADLMALAVSGSERYKAHEAANLANSAKSSFLANMSHEIRTPMNAILGVTELLISNEQLPADIEEGLDKIYNSCDMLLGIINDILDFSKIEAGKLDIMPSPYKVASMINDSVQLNMMRVESKPIEFELKIDENTQANLIGDSLRIKQILNNLLSNAFKYTDSGKVILSVSTEPIPLISYLPDHLMNNQVKWLGHDREGIILVLSVRDTGNGMTKDQLKKLFEEYTRFNLRKNLTIEGTGLGLTITKRLVDLMDGNISVESEPDKGTHFIVKLPQETENREIIGSDVADNLRQFQINFMTRRVRNKIVRDPMPYGNILVVDDVETNIYVAVGLMKLYRLQIDTAMSGQEAIDKIKEGKIYDIIFMDHMMPEMDGIEAAKHIRALGYSEPIIALTANAVSGQADMFINNGFDDFISKPIDIRQMNTILNKFVRDKQPAEVIEAARRQNKNAVPAGYAVTGNSAAIDSVLMASFIRDAHKAAALLEDKNGFENGDTLKKFVTTVHGIKSSLSNIGEKELSDEANRLETEGREENIELLKELSPEFLNKLRQLTEKLESEREEDGGDTPGNEDIDDLRGRMAVIKKLCADYDRKGTLDSLNEIRAAGGAAGKSAGCSRQTRAVLDRITEHVLHSEFEEAEAEAEAYMDTLGETKTRLLDKKIDGLDMATGLERYEGDEKQYLRVLRSYKSSVGSLLEEIEKEPDEGTIKNYEIKVHGIKGTSIDVGAGPIGIKAKELEEAAKKGDFSFIHERHKTFLADAWKLIGGLEKMFDDLEAENPKPHKDSPDTETLKKFLDACKDYDIEEADKAMAEIEKYKYTADDGLADWLRDNIDRTNFREIIEKLESYGNERTG
ncbi:MAG: transporter substrate-binding domain-containing protein [Treponema sp.]|nr:transporter substrate-binding domain-containing protein [Treponema sp.]